MDADVKTEGREDSGGNGQIGTDGNDTSRGNGQKTNDDGCLNMFNHGRVHGQKITDELRRMIGEKSKPLMDTRKSDGKSWTGGIEWLVTDAWRISIGDGRKRMDELQKTERV